MAFQVESEDPYTVSVECQCCRWWVHFTLERFKEIDEATFICSICDGTAMVDRDWDLCFQV